MSDKVLDGIIAGLFTIRQYRSMRLYLEFVLLRKNEKEKKYERENN